MRNFLKLAEGIDTTPMLAALARNPDLWDRHPIRTQHPGTAHADVSDILVFFNDLENPEAIIADRQVKPFPAWDRLPQLRPLIYGLMAQVAGVQLGRVIITRLPPGKTITPHIDGGAPATFYDRYHLSLKSLPGCVFHAGDEAVQMASGSVWWFDNQQVHSVVNNSAEDRITCIVDIRSA